jgi:glycosyltransferase involved in cell wall biosynthesis
MKIGIDVRCFAEGRKSGVEEYAEGLLSELFRIDRENQYVLFFNAWGNVPPDFSWATKYPNVTIRSFRFPNKLLNLSLWYFGWPKLDRLIGGTDVFFLPNINFADVSDKTRLCVTAHDLSFEAYPETFSLKRRLWHFFVNPKKLFRRADTIFAVSESTASDLRSRYRIDAVKIRVIHSGISDRFREMNRNDTALVHVKDQYHLPYQFILYLGAFEPRKNIIAIVRAYNALRKARHHELEKCDLVLAGVSGWKEQALRKEIEHSPFRGNIILPGFIADEDKPVLYNLASVFVYPSFYEGFGFPPLEAIACGVPVITSHSSSLPEIVGDAGVLVDPHKPDELFRALEEVLLDKRLRATLRERGLARVKDFSWEKTAREVLLAMGG